MNRESMLALAPMLEALGIQQAVSFNDCYALLGELFAVTRCSPKVAELSGNEWCALVNLALARHTQRHPTLAECEASGRGPENYPGKPFEVGGLPATKEERARFEAYMRGHVWDVGHYVDADECYDTTFVRGLWGVWRDRGALPTIWPNVGNEGCRKAVPLD